METQTLILNVNSENPAALISFYRDVVGLTPEPGVGDGGFKIADTGLLIIDGHDDVKGKTQEAPRYLIDFVVNDIATEQARLEAAGVACHRVMGREPWGGIISTFSDPDGNYFQLIQHSEG
ncbi:MAG: VOC family protein [Dehalococcoidia bacterium]|nr:VOC family protein [Dehalococcoidia bacterium]